MRLLLIGDFACATGFARVTENIARNLKGKWDIDVMGINYHGDPHPLQKSFNIFPASLEGDVFGMNRIVKIVATGGYDLIFIVNDIWIIDMYLQKLQQLKDLPPIVFYTPVDAEHLKRAFIEPLNKWATHGIFYTDFGVQEALKSGLMIPTSVIPHGVDTSLFHFMPHSVARKETGIPEDWFVMLMVDRNQPRKRLDLGFYYFSEWVKQTNKPENVKIYYHGALQDQGIDIEDWCQYLGIDNRLIVTSHQMTMSTMLPVDKLKFVYGSADVFWKPCGAEGWGLTLHEAMACARPAIVPRSSALAEWPNGAVEYIENETTIPNVNPGLVNTIMYAPKLADFIEAAEKLYNDATYRKDLGYRGYKLATKQEFQWKSIAARFDAVFQNIVKARK